MAEAGVAGRRETGGPHRFDTSHVTLAAATLTALVLCLANLGRASLWLDEATSVNLARAPWSDFWHVVTTKEANMSLYYLLVRGWVLAGRSEAVLRLPSALAAAATVPVVFFLARRLFDRRVASLAAVLLAVNAFVVRYAHEVRGYTLVALGVCASTLLLLRARERPTPARWLAYGAVAGLSLYAHFFAGMVIVAHLIWLLAARPRPPWRRAAVALAPLAVFGVPLLVFLAGQRGGQIAWIPRALRGAIVPTFKALTGFGGRPLLALYFLACAAAGVAWLVASRRRERDRADGLLLVLLWAAVPVALTFGISSATPVLRPQYLIVAVPALAILAAAGIALLPRPAALVALAAVVALAAGGLRAESRARQTHDWRAATRHVLARSEPGDVVYFDAYYGRTPFWYYVDLAGAVREDRAPRSIRPSLAWTDTRPATQDDPTFAIDTIERASSRLWLVLNNARTDRPTPDLARLLAILKRRYRLETYAEFAGGIRIGLYAPASTGSA